MAWEQSIRNKSQEQLDASAEAHRQQVTDDYRATLNGLEEEISKARFTLSSIQQDTGDIHALRLKEYEAAEEEIKKQSYEVALQAQQVKQDQDALAAAQNLLNEHILNESNRVEANTAAFLTAKDQVDAQVEALNKQKEDQDAREKNVQDMETVLNEKKTELDALARSLSQKESEIVVQRQQLANDVLLHQQAIEDHKVEIEAFNIAQQRNMDFHAAILAKEETLEPLRDQYQAGIDANAKEALRLRDENIRVYAVSKDAEKRLALAIEAEKRANSQLDRLETLKLDLHESITPKES